MAVGGRFWEGLRVSSPAPDAIDGEFSRFLPWPDLLFQRLRVYDGFLHRGWQIGGTIIHEVATPIGFTVVANDDSRTGRTGDLLRYGVGSLVNLIKLLARTSRHIQSFAALCRFVKLGSTRI
jgi:hypothetical protein